MKKIIPLIIALTGLLHFTGAAQEKKGPSLIRGIVQDAATREPLPNMHVYIIKGEEEAITDSRGNFSIRSWQSFPLRIQATGKGYVLKEIQVVNDRQQIAILLTKAVH